MKQSHETQTKTDNKDRHTDGMNRHMTETGRSYRHTWNRQTNKWKILDTDTKQTHNEWQRKTKYKFNTDRQTVVGTSTGRHRHKQGHEHNHKEVNHDHNLRCWQNQPTNQPNTYIDLDLHVATFLPVHVKLNEYHRLTYAMEGESLFCLLSGYSALIHLLVDALTKKQLKLHTAIASGVL